MPATTNNNGSERGFTMLLALFALLLSMAALLAVAFKLNGNQSQARAQAPAAASTSASAGVQQVKINIKSDEEHGKFGSDGNWHDAFLPADYTVHAGATVKVTVYNYDDMPHSFTSPGLGTNAKIAAGSEDKPSVTTFTFHAPQKAGSYGWFCALPCDSWAMMHNGFMRGYVKVV